MTPNREDIIAMAREAGFDKAYVSEEAALSLLVPIERLFKAAYAAGAAAEREACAKVCDDLSAHYWAKDDAIESVNCEECATAIRARGRA